LPALRDEQILRLSRLAHIGLRPDLGASNLRRERLMDVLRRA
jgi:hypothetical protein